MARGVDYVPLYGYAKAQSRSELHLPRSKDGYWLTCDFHTHTTLSDGCVSPMERVDEAWREGLDAVALTDHATMHFGRPSNYDAAYTETESYAASRGIMLIKGVEITCDKPVGHFNLLFLHGVDDYLHPDYPMPDETAEAFIRRAFDEGAVVVYNHPGWPDHTSRLYDLQLRLLREGRIHAMEVFSGADFYPVVLDYCKQYALAPIGATDLHHASAACFNSGNQRRDLTLVLVKGRTQEAIREAVIEGATLAWADNKLAGDAALLLQFMQQSLEVVSREGSSSDFNVTFRNVTDIPYYIRGAHGQIFQFPPQSLTRLYISSQDMREPFYVDNFYVAEGRKFSFHLTDLFGVPNEPLLLPLELLDVEKVSFQLYHQIPSSLAALIQENREADEKGVLEEITTQPFAGRDTFAVRFDLPLMLLRRTTFCLNAESNMVVRIYVNGELVADNDSMCRIIALSPIRTLPAGRNIVTLWVMQDFRGQRFDFSMKRVMKRKA